MNNNNTFIDFLSSDTSLQLNWHHVTQSKWINRWLNNEFKNLMILAPPRSGKSMIVSEKLPLYLDNKFSDANTIVATYNNSRAEDLQLNFRRAHVCHNSNIKFIGVGTQLSGCGAKYILMDNLNILSDVKYSDNIWNWYHSSLATQGTSGFKQLLVASRWPNDLSSHLMELDSFKRDWIVIKFPLVAEQDSQYRKTGDILWDVYGNQEAVKKLQDTIGLYQFNALYQQNPIEQMNEY